ncbi:24859_t:CDS:10 [Dentiscutata erythropus]|uniref:24859_t:CDS:1 n=1 Tax=Dentiscutata erythropus TaxID=1348616 RepID=A0A9N8WR31_9GLOM|nr:24859_t:CDS:10 [Dentiscutata erythropus]
MTRETPLAFEVHSPSSPIVIPVRRASSNISTPLTPPKMSPITESPMLGGKLVTLTSQPSSKSNGVDLQYMSSNGFRSTSMLPNTTGLKSEVSKTGEFFKKNRSYSHAKSTSDILGVNSQISSLVRNPFSECEIFTTEVSKPLPESNAKKLNGANTPLSEVRNKPNVIQDNNNENQNNRRDKKLRRRSSWDIVELLALDNFRNWMVCFCVVNFDLELGQAMDSMYPPSELGEEEKKSICFSAFPDSNSFDVGETVFNFRIRCSKSGLAASGPTADAGFLYGYVFFRQKKDPRIKRGYFQRSLVLLSQHPYVGLFSRVVSILGPAYFEVGNPMLEAACHDIASWKSPCPSKLIDLPFLGNVIQVEIPQPNKPQLLETCPFDMTNYRPDLQILASLPPTSMFTHFRDMIKDLWLCWELMLFAEPIVLMAPNPKICSESVLELMDIINPIPYCGDYRPYFTIQDLDFKSFVTKNKPPSNIIIGVTNPFFIKALAHWPNLVRVGKPKVRRTTDNSWRGSHASSLEFVQGVKSKRKSVIAKDKAILKRLAEAVARGYPPDLTEKFLVPLNRYFSTLIPFHITLSSSQEPPQLKPFKTDSFLKSLQEHGPQIPFKTKKFQTNTTETYLNFYTQFLKCGNFATWLRQRTIEAQNELRKRYLQVLCEGDVKTWMVGKHEMELVDLLVRVKDELKLSTTQDSLSDSQSMVNRECDHVSLSVPTPKQREKLKAQADIIISGLPRDLRESFTAGI